MTADSSAFLHQSTSASLEFPSGEKVDFDDICTIGRSPGNKVVIASERVSRRHAVIRRGEDGAFQIMDMGSSNGTYVDGLRLARPMPLRDGAEIEIGLQKMVFHAAASEAANASTDQPTFCICWLLVLDAVERGCRTPSQDLADKTFEGWTERCLRVLARHRGSTMRVLHQGLLAFWRAEGGVGNAAAVADALRSVRAVQLHTEEFRFSLHLGTVEMVGAATGNLTPAGADVIHAIELLRIGRTFNTPVLISSAAQVALGGLLATRVLLPNETPEYHGSERFFTLAGDSAASRP
ncbi:MAG TPA: FHA domain-containing protein [Chthoniobacteraceae bacterium]|nr:FHA domain-containing protein [Chthoniobacteraceae bacterium]